MQIRADIREMSPVETISSHVNFRNTVVVWAPASPRTPYRGVSLVSNYKEQEWLEERQMIGYTTL
jgi:hypothetical protein